MQHYNFPWPDRMSCDQFPEYNNPQGILCMERNLTDSTNGGRTHSRNYDVRRTVRPEDTLPTETESPLLEVTSSNILPDAWLDRFNMEATHTLLNKAMQNKTIRKWMKLDPGLKLACQCECLVTTSRTSQEMDSYPELPIIYLSTCYFMVSLGYLIRLILGHESVACDAAMMSSTMHEDNPISDLRVDTAIGGTELPLLTRALTTVAQDISQMSSFNRVKVLRYATSGRASCAIVFLLVYFFSMASSVWWVILTFTWFLAAGLKWGSEAISRYSQVFHFIAWSVPTALTALALLLSVVEGDPTSGLCTVGTNRPLARILFLFAPCLVLLALGVIFLLAGFVALFRIRGVIKLQRIGLTKTDRLETLMLRIGVFGALYAIPNITVLVCMGYELRDTYVWQLGQVCRCVYETTSVSRVLSPLPGSNTLPEWVAPKPDYIMFLLKHFMSLIIGVTSGFWIWSHKTLNSWRLLCRGRCCPSGGGSQSGTVRLLPNTTIAELDGSSKQNLVPWIGFPSAVSMHAVTHPGSSGDPRGTFVCRGQSNNSEQFGKQHPIQTPLPPVPTGKEVYYYDRVHQTSINNTNNNTSSGLNQRRMKGCSNRSDGSQTLLSPYTDNSDRPTMLEGSADTPKNSTLLMHPSMSSISGFHSPGKSVTNPNNWSALSSSGISSGLTMVGQVSSIPDSDNNTGYPPTLSKLDSAGGITNRTMFPNKRPDLTTNGYKMENQMGPSQQSNDYHGYYSSASVSHDAHRNHFGSDNNQCVFSNSAKDFHPAAVRSADSGRLKSRSGASESQSRVGTSSSPDQSGVMHPPGILKV
ncbi:unnamed protein product [Echinostoma caproni]|uniref:G_PROTEIN_RECEP_F2_4 domain-containing protein n=1 Tax=Echinostoma caproni TaxID=27848 RepID=A0A183A9E4_9TREM|nr:unnamed protein product [Echinostoma caproni]